MILTQMYRKNHFYRTFSSYLIDSRKFSCLFGHGHADQMKSVNGNAFILTGDERAEYENGHAREYKVIKTAVWHYEEPYVIFKK